MYVQTIEKELMRLRDGGTCIVMVTITSRKPSAWRTTLWCFTTEQFWTTMIRSQHRCSKVNGCSLNQQKTRVRR